MSTRTRPRAPRSLFGAAAVLSLVLLLSLSACRGDSPDRDEPVADEYDDAYGETLLDFGELPPTLPDSVAAVAILEPIADSNVHGHVLFIEENGGIRVRAEILGLAEGEYGFHVHETGDCSAADGSSAGGHFDPEAAPHGAPDAPDSIRHVGDLGNLTVDSRGRGTYDRVDRMITLTGPHSVLGRAVIVHGEADDLESQPSGAAGARVACGVIGLPE